MFTYNKVINWSGGGYLNDGGTGSLTNNVFDNNNNHLNVDATGFTLAENAFTRAAGAPIAFGLYRGADLSTLVAAGNSFDEPGVRDLSIYPYDSSETVTGSSFDDVFRGNSDLTYTTFGFSGGGGNDTMLASAGSDTFYGGAGSDVLEGTAALLNGDTFIFGDYGDKIVVDNASNLRATFTNGQILIDGDGNGTTDAAVAFVNNPSGVTVAVTTNAISFIAPPAPPPPPPPSGPTTTPNDQGGNDVTASDPSQVNSSQGTSGVDNVTYTGSGTVTLPENIENITLSGTADSSVVGNGLGNVETGNAGSNTLVSAEGDDTAAGGAGSDVVYGNQGADLAYGNQGTDVLFGGQGSDQAFGGTGTDLIYGNAGADTLHGNAGADALLGGSGTDSLFGGQGADVLSGNAGADALLGDAGADIIYGNQGADLLSGGDGNDVLFGGQGNDILTGGVGSDTLAGGVGADVYVFGANSGQDLILGFSQADGDKLSLGGQSYTLADDGQGGTLLTLSGGGTIDLAGVAQSSVTPAAFA